MTSAKNTVIARENHPFDEPAGHECSTGIAQTAFSPSAGVLQARVAVGEKEDSDDRPFHFSRQKKSFPVRKQEARPYSTPPFLSAPLLQR